VFCVLVRFCFLFFLVLTSINRYNSLIEIDILRKITFSKTSFFKPDYFINFIIEVIISLIHPNIILKGKKMNLKKLINGYDTKYEINDILCLFSFIKIYVLFRYFFSISEFESPKSNKIW